MTGRETDSLRVGVVIGAGVVIVIGIGVVIVIGVGISFGRKKTNSISFTWLSGLKDAAATALWHESNPKSAAWKSHLIIARKLALASI